MDQQNQTTEPEVTEEVVEDVAEEVMEEQAPSNEEALLAQISDMQNQLLRQRAEFDNYRKRTVKEKEDLTAYVKSSCAEPLIQLLDNFERALQCECTDDNFKKGIDMLFEQFKGSLASLGIEEIDCVGKVFDPNFHNAVNQIQDENFGENTVCQVFQKGYKLGEKVVRHAMVVVANP